MATEKFIRAEAAQQSVFGTAASTGFFAVPATGEYEDGQEEHSAEYDSGTWTPTTIVEQVAEYATFSLDGAGFFELLPAYLSAGFAEQVGIGAAAPYSYIDRVSPPRTGTPKPYTFLFGSRTNIGGTGPGARIQDAYCQSIVLTGNINTKAVALRSSWFGLRVDDNSAAGFAMQNAGLPSSLGMIKTLLGAISLKDAGSTGQSFSSMTALTGVMLDWTLTIDTGLRPLWVTDSNRNTFAGVRYEPPVITFAPVMRVTSTVYSLIRTKFDAKTYQELQLTLTGASSRQAVLQFTGRWTSVPTATARGEGEQVMRPTFTAETPHTQTVGLHYAGWTIDTRWLHGSSDYLAQEDDDALLQEDGSPILA